MYHRWSSPYAPNTVNNVLVLSDLNTVSFIPTFSVTVSPWGMGPLSHPHPAAGALLWGCGGCGAVALTGLLGGCGGLGLSRGLQGTVGTRRPPWEGQLGPLDPRTAFRSGC